MNNVLKGLLIFLAICGLVLCFYEVYFFGYRTGAKDALQKVNELISAPSGGGYVRFQNGGIIQRMANLFNFWG